MLLLTSEMKSVYQCIYSQCDTAHFGSALHYTITQCNPFNAGKHNEFIFAVPPSHRDDLRRREAAIAAGSKIDGSGAAYEYPTESVNSSPTQDAKSYPTQSVNSYPTQSVNYYRRSAVGVMDSPSPTPAASPVVDIIFESPTPSPTTTSADSNLLTTAKSALAEATVAATAKAQSAITASTTMPVIYTSQAISLRSFFTLPMLGAVAAIYLFV